MPAITVAIDYQIKQTQFHVVPHPKCVDYCEQHSAILI